MSQLNPNDEISYVVVVHGIDAEAFELTAVRFNTRRGGARPHDLSRYISIPIAEENVENCLSWINQSIAGKFNSIKIGVSVSTKLTWSTFSVPAEVLTAAVSYNAALDITFTSHGASASVKNDAHLA